MSLQRHVAQNRLRGLLLLLLFRLRLRLALLLLRLRLALALALALGFALLLLLRLRLALALGFALSFLFGRPVAEAHPVHLERGKGCVLPPGCGAGTFGIFGLGGLGALEEPCGIVVGHTRKAPGLVDHLRRHVGQEGHEQQQHKDQPGHDGRRDLLVVERLVEDEGEEEDDDHAPGAVEGVLRRGKVVADGAQVLAHVLHLRGQVVAQSKGRDHARIHNVLLAAAHHLTFRIQVGIHLAHQLDVVDDARDDHHGGEDQGGDAQGAVDAEQVDGQDDEHDHDGQHVRPPVDDDPRGIVRDLAHAEEDVAQVLVHGGFGGGLVVLQVAVVHAGRDQGEGLGEHHLADVVAAHEQRHRDNHHDQEEVPALQVLAPLLRLGSHALVLLHEARKVGGGVGDADGGQRGVDQDHDEEDDVEVPVLGTELLGHLPQELDIHRTLPILAVAQAEVTPHPRTHQHQHQETQEPGQQPLVVQLVQQSHSTGTTLPPYHLSFTLNGQGGVSRVVEGVWWRSSIMVTVKSTQWPPPQTALASTSSAD